MLEFTHSSLRCTLLRRLVYRRHPSYSPCRLLLNSRRVLLHIRFCRCTSSVSDFPPFSLMLLVGVTAGYNSIRLLVPSPSTTHFSRHTSLFGVRFWSDGVSERYAWLRRVRWHRFIWRNSCHCSSLASSKNIPYCIALLTEIWTLFLCYTSSSHCTKLFWYYVITATSSLIIPLVLTNFIVNYKLVDTRLQVWDSIWFEHVSCPSWSL